MLKKIENASFPYKTASWETNVKRNRMVVQNGPITKNGVLPGTTLFFWKFRFILKKYTNAGLKTCQDLCLYT